MRRSFILFVLFAAALSLSAQKPGENRDPFPQGRGEPPYEMAGRQERRAPSLTFEDCTRWTVEAKGAEAGLYRSEDHPLFRRYNGKLMYRATDKVTEIVVRPQAPVPLADSVDCIDFWNYGAHWLWGKPDHRRAFQHYVLLRDGRGELHTINFVQSGYKGMVYRYWFLNHLRLPATLPRPLTFEGLLFRGRDVTDEEPLSIYLGPLYFYKEELAPLHFARDTSPLPFPMRRETILPPNKTERYRNRVAEGNGYVDLLYEGDDATLRYRVLTDDGPPLRLFLVRKKHKLALLHEGGIRLTGDVAARWHLQEQKLAGDTLFVTMVALTDDRSIPFRFFYTVRQKSLIVGMEELSDNGHVTEVALGSTGPLKKGMLFSVPFLNFNYAEAPRVLYDDGMFLFMQFDWYYSDASMLYTSFPGVEGGYATHNGGARYVPRTDGLRNPLHERLFITASPDVEEVFPTVDNPPSPMRSYQAGRLWRINGSADYAALCEEAGRLRSLGLEHLTIRYHEGFWRDGGESYTFRLEAAPGRGGNAAVKELVRCILSQGWRAGVYTNYTDLAPVNRNWDPDMMLRGPHGEWQVSWSRCYAPKPTRAVEYERTYAPLIHRMFGTNHSYCDVHTAVSPFSRVDYDARVPGAATFRKTFECYGQILLNEKVAYAGPVYSEGGNHWWYAGLVDGNYANARPALDRRPVFPAFQLLRLHTLEMDAGNVQATGRKYLAYTLAYGHIGICDGSEEEMMHRYYMLQPLQPHYVMVPVKAILYEKNGTYHTSSEALVQGLTERPRLKILYRSGLEVYINFGEEDWAIEAGGYSPVLPQYGFFAISSDGTTLALAGREPRLTDGRDADLMISPDLLYLDTRGKEVKGEMISGKGKIAMKKERFGWEIIPARTFGYFAFMPDIAGAGIEHVSIEALDREGMPLAKVPCYQEEGKNGFRSLAGAWKYRIVPVP